VALATSVPSWIGRISDSESVSSVGADQLIPHHEQYHERENKTNPSKSGAGLPYREMIDDLFQQQDIRLERLKQKQKQIESKSKLVKKREMTASIPDKVKEGECYD
jgi:flagellar capping protein FliD